MPAHNFRTKTVDEVWQQIQRDEQKKAELRVTVGTFLEKVGMEKGTEPFRALSRSMSGECHTNSGSMLVPQPFLEMPFIPQHRPLAYPVHQHRLPNPPQQEHATPLKLEPLEDEIPRGHIYQFHEHEQLAPHLYSGQASNEDLHQQTSSGKRIKLQGSVSPQHRLEDYEHHLEHHLEEHHLVSKQVQVTIFQT